MRDGQALGFADWFAPRTIQELKRQVLGLRPLLVDPRPDLAARVLRAINIASVDDLIALKPQQLFAWFNRSDGTHTTANIPPSSARAIYDGGMTILGQDFPELAPREAEVAHALGIAPSASRFSVFCSPGETVTPGHFDPIDLIVVQLRGRKRWRVAENTFAPFPFENWAPGRPVPPEMRAYAPDLPPIEMPKEVITYNLEPGAVLHVPRGFWHATTCDQESLALHVVLRPPTRMSIILAALTFELRRSEWWRRPAYDIGLDGDEDEASEVVSRFKEAASRLAAEDITPPSSAAAPVDVHTEFRRRGQAHLALDGIQGASSSTRISVTAQDYRGTTRTHLEISDSIRELCLHINNLATGSQFLSKSTVDNGTAATASSRREILRQLELAGLIRRIPTRT